VAGSDAAPARAALAAWLRRAAQHADAAARLVLRGSLVLGVYCPARARPAADIDYLIVDAPGAPATPGAVATFDPDATERLARAVVAVPDAAPLVLERSELTWAETAFPGLRAHLRAGEVSFHVDLAAGDPLSLPPRAIRLAGVDTPVLACAAETLFAWKLHGLCEHGAGRWRAKDLHDLDVLWHDAEMARAALRPAIELAFSSRGTSLAALDDFRLRDGWGQSRGGVRKWRQLAKQLNGAVDDFLATRARVRAALDAILGAGTAPPTA
jgi:hypothetical protein